MEWYDKLDELEAKGYRVDDRIRYPDGHCGQRLPEHWTPEQIVNYAYDYVKALEKECPNIRVAA